MFAMHSYRQKIICNKFTSGIFKKINKYILIVSFTTKYFLRYFHDTKFALSAGAVEYTVEDPPPKRVSWI